MKTLSRHRSPMRLATPPKAYSTKLIGDRPIPVDAILFARWRQTAMNSDEAVQASAAMLAHSRRNYWT